METPTVTAETPISSEVSNPQPIEESKDESQNSSSDSVVTGKRVRKKNPKYLDGERVLGGDNFTVVLSRKSSDSTSRPKKKRKTTLNSTASSPLALVPDTNVLHVTPIIQPPPISTSIKLLEEQKKELEQQLTVLSKDLDDVKQQLIQKHAEYGITMVPDPCDNVHYDDPTDDEEDPMDIADPPLKPNPVRGRGARGGRGRRKTTTPRKPTTKRKSTTTPTPPAPVVQRPRRANVSIGDVGLLPEFMFCREVLDQLMKHRFGFPFNVPVDPELLQIPDYFLVIKHPMDFGTIRSKLNSSQYSHPSEYIADVNLVFNNACTYNQPTSDVFIMADTLRKLFKEKIKILDKKKIPGSQEIKRSVDRSREIRQVPASKPSPVIRRVPPKPKRDVEHTPLTKDEKKKLSVDIQSLSGAQLTVVVNIIKEKLPDIGGGKEEIVIDIDSLDTGTLRALETYVRSTKKKKSKRKATSKRRGTTAMQVDPAARLELAKQTEIGMQSKIESVQRQLEELSGNGLNSSTSGFGAQKKAIPQELEHELEPIPQVLPPQPATTRHSSSASDNESDSESEESESESEESDSDTEARVYESKTKSTVVETVVAPVLTNTVMPNMDIDAPRIISTSPAVSEVNADKIENVASWADLGSSNVDEGTTNNQSSEGANLWSSIRDSHAQLKQKEHETILHEEKLKREQEEQEVERLRLEEEERQHKLEEEEKQRQLDEEAKLQADREIEEARLKAKRDREKKVEEDESGNLDLSLSDVGFGLGLTGPGLMGMNISGQVMSDIRSSLKASGPLDQRSPGHNN